MRNVDWCKDCAIRLFNKKHYNLQGVGNPWSGKCIVVPNVDYDAYKTGDMSFSKQVELIKQIIPFSTGEEEPNLYILPLIRCNERISCKLDNESYRKCLHYFAEDVSKYDFRDILLLGDAGRRFLSIDITSWFNTIFVSSNNRRYAVNYSPFISYVNSNKFETFKTNLYKWYNAVSNIDFKGYEIKRI